ncbi:MAG: M1 family aminopeptidase [Ignavibacteria bacterium]
MRYIKFSRLLFSLLILGFSLSSVYAQMFGQEPLERVRTYDVQHIKIEVKLDLEKKTVEGITTTSIVPLAGNFNLFKVDAAGMKIESVQQVSGKSKTQVKSLNYEYDNLLLTVKLGNDYKVTDTIVYIVEYNTTDPEKGLYFIKPDSIFPNKPYQVWTQGEGEDNRYWFPCYDYPNDKATTEVIITTDKKYITLSNGNLLNTKNNIDGTITWHWLLNKPHVSYLVMLAVGNFDIIEDRYDDVPIYSYVPPGSKETAIKSFSETSEMIKFFSEKIGFKYPWERFSQIAVKDFIYGGMENTGAIVYWEGSVYDDLTPPDYTATGLVAHEIAHQWWGDVLTCRNWNEIWLNESFATYFDALYKEYSKGKDEFDYQIMKSGDAAITVDSTSARKPIYIRDGLTTNTYSKGSVVLNMLRNQIGTENFWKAMNIYITKNQFQCVTTPDLIDAVNQAMDNPLLDQTPPNYKWFFDEWIYSAGQPEYKVSYDYNENSKELKLTASQVQRLDSSSVFKTPVEAEIITENLSDPSGVRKKIISLYTTYEPQTWTFVLNDKPLNIIFNKGNKVLCKLYFSKPKRNWLYQLEKSEDVIDRITAIKGLKDFINDEDVIEALKNTMKYDSFWGLRYEAASMLGKSISKKVPLILMQAYQTEGDSRIRRVILSSLVNIKQQCSDCADKNELLSFITASMNSEKGYYAIASGISAISRIEDKDKVYDIVTPYLKMDSHNEVIRRNVLTAIDSSEDKRATDIFLEYAHSGSTTGTRNTAINGLGDYLYEQRVIDFLNSKLSDKFRSTKLTVISLLDRAGNKSSKPYLEQALKKTNDEDLKKEMNKVLRKLE